MPWQKYFFKPCVSDIYAQNGSAKRVERLMMEKAWAIKLSANLPLWYNNALFWFLSGDEAIKVAVITADKDI